MTPQQKTILILDDEESIRKSIAAYMEDEGYIVYQAATGEEALDILRSTAIDRAIVDIRLPGMNGESFILESRKILPEIGFVVHTGSSDYIPSNKAVAAGVTSEKIFFKPAKDLGEICKALDE